MPRRLPDILPIRWPEGLPLPPTETERSLDRAADVLRSGGLVAIPTETVYGLAADALDPAAVESIFRAKGRPAGNPLIVHVTDESMARSLTVEWPDAAAEIATKLWPGPVTVVVRRNAHVPDAVTCGGPTVAIRCPEHRLARRLIEKVGRPLAAPSANRSEAVSPTTAHHVLEGLGNRVDLILDGGPSACGIESTVVDCTVKPPRILRPGPIDRTTLEAAVGRPLSGVGSVGVSLPGGPAEPARSPGTLARHYAPRTPLELAADGPERVAALLRAGTRVGWLALEPDTDRLRPLAAAGPVVVVPMPADARSFAHRLYATLHALDQRGLDVIVVDAPPATEPWQAVRDRLSRAARRTSATLEPS